jgi:hypothetical protein
MSVPIGSAAVATMPRYRRLAAAIATVMAVAIAFKSRALRVRD